MDVLLVAAVVEELEGQAGHALGVGMVRAAARMARLLEVHRPARVVLVGTAGAYPVAGAPRIGEVVTASSVALGSGTAALGRGYVPQAPPPIQAVPAGGLPAHAVLCCTAITSDVDLAVALGVHATVEHMEAYGVALACQDAGVPFCAVLAVTNIVGPDAHAQWKANRAEAQAAAVRATVAGFALEDARPPDAT